ncbi:MAG: hypothetical protein LKM31_00080 [Sphingobium sp.]|jgi:conjugal transfer mating pair stabilization protein TraG|nr:hypothetical protein [Sphingobium sp.]
MTDTFLDATIKDYVRQCYPVARVSPAYGVDDDKLFRTPPTCLRRSRRWRGQRPFQHGVHRVHRQGRHNGELHRCLGAYLGPAVRPALFDSYSAQVCTRTGYDIGQCDPARALPPTSVNWDR